ncbi:MAG: DUF4369 domain-containing protein [Bacteroidales bacterium]|nr:DUF4369 domain-containing protein [Bacteroidales bacterium]
MKNSIIALLAALVLAGCHHDSFTISGTLEGGAGHTLWLEELGPEGPIFIDSIPLDRKGHFKYTCSMPYRSLYNLHTTEDNYLVALPDYGEKLQVKGRWENLSLSYTISGSRESQLLWQLQQYTNDGSRILRALVDSLTHNDALLAGGVIDEWQADERKEALDSIYREAALEQQEYVCRFIEENRGSLACLIALYKPFNNRPLIDPRDPGSISYYDLTLEGLQNEMPDNPHTLHFKNTTEHLRSALARQQE